MHAIKTSMLQPCADQMVAWDSSRRQVIDARAVVHHPGLLPNPGHPQFVDAHDAADARYACYSRHILPPAMPGW